MRSLRVLVALMALAALAGGPGGAATSTSESGGRAWIDDPLSGLTVAPGTPVAVLAHAADQRGVTEARLEVDGDVVATVPAEGGRLARVTFAWTPSATGAFTLGVRGRSAGGTWGKPGTTVVLVLEGGGVVALPGDAPPPTDEPGPDAPPPSTTTTTAPIATPGPGPTPGPPPTSPPPTPPPPCTAGIPVPTAPHDFYLAVEQPITFQWSYEDPCAAQAFVIVVTDADGATVGGATVGATQWTAPRFAPGNQYFWKVAAVHDGAQGPFSGTRTFVVPA